jgi:hypothetical protein
MSQTTKKIDVVYVLGKGSRWNNNEIRFSLRSIEKNLKNYRRIFIIGEDPGFLKKVTVIPCEDIFSPSKNADGNIITKVLRACEERGLTRDFLFINDDHLIMKEINAIDVPYFHKGNMIDFPHEYFELNFWRKRLWRTKNILHKKGYPAFHYDCHTPIVFNKKAFVEAMSNFDYKEGIGYTMKSLYANVVCPEKAVTLKGQKKTLFNHRNVEQTKERVKNAAFVSFNDDSLNPALKQWLYESFPEQSSYEKTLPSGKEVEVLNWYNSGKNIEEGILIYMKYGNSKMVERFLLTCRNDKLKMKKLEIHLKKMLYR